MTETIEQLRANHLAAEAHVVQMKVAHQNTKLFLEEALRDAKGERKRIREQLRAVDLHLKEKRRDTSRRYRDLQSARRQAAALRRKWKNYPYSLRAWGKKNTGKVLEKMMPL